MDFSGRKLPDMPYSALLGSTVDTCLRHSTENCGLFYVFGWTRLLRTILVLLCGFPVPQILEQIVEVSLFSLCLLDR